MTKLFFYIILTSLVIFSSCTTEDVNEDLKPTVEVETNVPDQTVDQATADFKIDNQNEQVMEKEALLITNSSSNAVAYHWDFGNGDSSTEANPNYAYDLHGYFTVILTVTDKNGDEVEMSHNVEVLCPFEGQIHTTSN